MTPEILLDRSFSLQKSRAFFLEKGLVEIDSPILQSYPSIDAYIDLLEVKKGGYLHSSPEFYLKKLLSRFSKEVFYLGHVFRKEEDGAKHSSEFTMAEWYRKNFTLEQMIQETLAFIALFISFSKIEKLSYQELFLKFYAPDPLDASLESLREFCRKKAFDLFSIERDFYLHLIFSHYLEPHLDADTLYIIEDFPKSQAALAKTEVKKGKEIAKRFEIYFQGLELANGYEELTEKEVQKKRFISENQIRVSLKKEPYPLDPSFLQALDSLPACCGVSVGFDRLMMLRHKAKNIQEVIHS